MVMLGMTGLSVSVSEERDSGVVEGAGNGGGDGGISCHITFIYYVYKSHTLSQRSLQGISQILTADA